ncbi:hypothetical protein E4U41_005943 [Claviceps citrina]|nr:hypothetical protein E4U41_005943 [Claviceps citrina]
MDHLPGQPLQFDTLCSSATETRERFYADFADILAQLNELQFPRTGSLYPDSEDDERAGIGPSLYSVENDLRVMTRGTRRKTYAASTSATAVIRQHYDLLTEFCDMPCADELSDTVQREIFALDGLADLLPEFCRSAQSDGTFALCHPDLRCDNILVDDQLRIQGILDWEWTTILPRRLCTPPSWICGYAPGMTDARRIEMSEDFERAVSVSVNHKYSECVKFWKEDHFSLSIAQILRHPDELVPIYFKHIYPKIYRQAFFYQAKTFFASEDKQRKLERRLQALERYTQYLKQEELYVADEEDEKVREFMERSAKFLESIPAEMRPA